MTLRIRRWTVGAWVAWTAAACATTTEVAVGPETAVLDGNGELVLAVGDDVRVSGTILRLGLLEVGNDSRCPIDALILCVWEGDVEVRLSTASGTGPGSLHVLHANPTVGDDRISVDGTMVVLVAVEPAARADTTIAQEDYRVRLRIDPA